MSTKRGTQTEDNERYDAGLEPLGLGERLLDTVSSLLGAVMLLSGGSKLAGADRQVQSFEHWGYPQWFRLVTGTVEAVGGLGLLAGRGRPVFGVVGGGLTVGTMVGAVYTELVRAPDSSSNPRRPAALLIGGLLATGRAWERVKEEWNREGRRD